MNLKKENINICLLMKCYAEQIVENTKYTKKTEYTFFQSIFHLISFSKFLFLSTILT